jgi:hypothetical protein
MAIGVIDTVDPFHFLALQSRFEYKLTLAKVIRKFHFVYGVIDTASKRLVVSMTLANV